LQGCRLGSQGLLIEGSIDPFIYNADPVLEQVVKDGRAARKQVVASFAGRLLVMSKDNEHYDDEDAEQTELLQLTMAVINYAREFTTTRPENRPPEDEDIEDVWLTLKERMDSIKFNKDFTEVVANDKEKGGKSNGKVDPTAASVGKFRRPNRKE